MTEAAEHCRLAILVVIASLERLPAGVAPRLLHQLLAATGLTPGFAGDHRALGLQAREALELAGLVKGRANSRGERRPVLTAAGRQYLADQPAAGRLTAALMYLGQALPLANPGRSRLYLALAEQCLLLTRAGQQPGPLVPPGVVSRSSGAAHRQACWEILVAALAAARAAAANAGPAKEGAP